ncbi:hypothetical protein TVAG_430130 [Trichomonas vaginalis G3]|uniref:Uncharacterized protein n=1 Tax=Trichomonas vaginalis (strain ATCC PRA-98 / G3) TaxID=412133 RepID=A2EI89_TRIV3|nr:hypothetical protein TVAGG3_0776020 [Trichomonas vaginalis G3]EAY07649.1 hypothetical protein TVAG_430130 [Trichomonas vaginalis G3]KAI5494720.1 hypothetical protein TVAGG3_0776020 [Trichomonas vaginalis G3]|eukprot:XP_001319872.1 hypothetical protein [Trichomonas vaginalis G3]
MMNQECNINEPASLEAMRRLGISLNELNARNPQTFAKAGCDDTVTQFFYKKFEENRKSLIDQIKQKRQEVLNEKSDNRVVSADVRRDKIFIEKDKMLIQQQEQKTNNILKHMFMKRLREIHSQTLVEQMMQKTLSRTAEIARQQAEKIRTAQIRAMNFEFKSREKVFTPPEYRPSEPDPAELRRNQIRQEIAKQRHDQWVEKERQIQSARQRSQQLLDEKINTMKQSIEKSENRFQNWQKQAQTARLSRVPPQIRSYVEINETLKSREEDRRNALLETINRKENQFRENRAKIAEGVQTKYREIAKNEQEKLNRVKISRDAIEAENQQKREKFLQESEQKDMRAEQARSKDMLAVAKQIVDRDEKITQARRRKLAQDYEFQRSKMLSEEDQKARLETQREMARVNQMRTGAQIRVQQRMERLKIELARLRTLDDKKTLRNIRTILEVEENEMQEMISAVHQT